MALRYYEFLDGATPQRRRLVVLAMSLASLLLLVAFITLSYFLYVNEGVKSTDNVAVFNAKVDDTGELKAADAHIRILVVVTDIDPVRSVMTLNSKFRMDNESSRFVNGTLLLGSYSSVALTNRTHYQEQVVTAVADGDPNHYPFDVYTIELPYAVSSGDVLSHSNAPFVPWSGYAYGVLQNYRFDVQFVPQNRTSIVILQVTVTRSATTKGFALFIVVLMWALSITAALIAFQTWFRMRDVPAPLVAVFVSLLFALPAVRNTQPAVPPIGTLLDAVSLFWNMVIVACSNIAVMLAYFYQCPEPKPPEHGRTGSTTTLVPFKA